LCKKIKKKKKKYKVQKCEILKLFLVIL